MNPPFQLSSKNDNGKFLITGKYGIPQVNLWIMAGFFIFVFTDMFFQFYDKPYIPGWLVPFMIVIILIGGGLGVFIGKTAFKRYGLLKVVIDKPAKTIEFPLDNLNLDIKDIKDIAIAERTVGLRRVSLIMLQLNDGEKSLTFPFYSYNKAQDVLKLIKENIK